MDGGPSQELGKWAVELAAVTLQVPWESAIHSLTYSFTYLLIVNCVSGIEPVAGNISRRNMTQTLEFRVRLPGGLQDVAEIMSCMQLSRLIVRTSLVVQWLRICLQCRRLRFNPSSRNQDPTCLRAPPGACLSWSLRAATGEKPSCCKGRSHMLQPRPLHSQINKQFFKKVYYH